MMKRIRSSLTIVCLAIIAAAIVFPASASFEFKVSAIHDLLLSGKWNCSQVVSFFLKRCISYNPSIKALISMNKRAQTEAQELDAYFATHGGKLSGKLHCIPLLVKDNVDVAGLPTTGGIKALRHSVPTRDAPVVARLKREGAIVLAKANMAELAIGDIQDSEMGGYCSNPFDLSRSCGASSSGSGSGISTAMAIIGIGTDTDGSIIQPASYNGLFGMRTPIGYPQTDGVIPLFERQDTIGPLTKHLEDMVLAYSIMNDNETIWKNFQQDDEKPSPSLRLGYFGNFFRSFEVSTKDFFTNYLLDTEVREAMLQTIEHFRKAPGVDVIEYNLPRDEIEKLLPYAFILDPYKIILRCFASCLESSANKYFSNMEGHGAKDQPYKNFRAFVTSSYLSQLWRKRFSYLLNYTSEDANNSCAKNCEAYDRFQSELKSIVEDWFERTNADALLFPTFAHLPHPKQPKIIMSSEDLDFTYFLNCLSTISSHTGYPSMTFPVGYTRPSASQPDGLPIGALLFSTSDNFDKTLHMAKKYERQVVSSHERLIDKLPSLTPLLDKKCQFLEQHCFSASEVLLMVLVIAVALIYVVSMSVLLVSYLLRWRKRRNLEL